MNAWQICRQIRYKLLSQNWAGGSNRVFGLNSVHCSVGLPQNAKKVMQLPACLVYPGSSRVDPAYSTEPEVIESEISVQTIVVNPGDELGQKALIGGNVADRTTSAGRGILEVEEEILNAIQNLQTDDGIIVNHRSTGAAIPIVDPDIGYVLSRQYTFEAYCTASRFYHPVINLTATGAAGSVALAWTLPPDRYDRYRIRANYASGASAPTSATAATQITLASNLATSVTVTLAAGTYSFALWASYDETNDLGGGGTLAVDDRYSGSVTRLSVVVT